MPKKPENWEERFNKEFLELPRKGVKEIYEFWKRKWDGGDDITRDWVTPKIIKSFIRQELESVRKEGYEEGRSEAQRTFTL